MVASEELSVLEILEIGVSVMAVSEEFGTLIMVISEEYGAPVGAVLE